MRRDYSTSTHQPYGPEFWNGLNEELDRREKRDQAAGQDSSKYVTRRVGKETTPEPGADAEDYRPYAAFWAKDEQEHTGDTTELPGDKGKTRPMTAPGNDLEH